MPALNAGWPRRRRDAFHSRPPPDPVAVFGVSAAADLLAGQYEPEDQCRDRLDHESVAARSDARQLHPHLHRRELVFRLYQLAEICRHQHGDLELGRAARGLRVLALSVSRRQAPVLLAAVEPDGASRGLRAAVLQSLFGDRPVRYAVGGRARALHLQRPAGGVDPGRVRLRRAARDRRDRVPRRLFLPALLHQDPDAADRERHRRRRLLLLHVLMGRVVAGADADVRGRQADLGRDDPDRLGRRHGLGPAGRGRRIDHHTGRTRDLVRPQLYRARLRIGQGVAMESLAWMAWTQPTAIFFVLLAATLCVMTWLAIAYPEAERVGILRIPTTRGDRLFISLIMAAVIHLLWIGFIGTDPIARLPIGEGIDLSSLWLATVISLVSAVAIFRTV